MAKTFYDVDIPMVDGISKEDILSIKDGAMVQVDGTTGKIVIL